MKQITLVNFRCFKNLELTFNSSINLLIGDNASGKTTIILALSKVLSTLFLGFSDENTRYLGLSKSDFSILKTNNGLVNEMPVFLLFSYLEIKSSFLQLNTKKSSTLKTPLEEIKNFGKKLYKEMFDEKNVQVKSLPLIACFSTKDIHITRKFLKKGFSDYDKKPSFGYYECLQGDGFLPYWTKRMLSLKEADKGELEIDGVSQAIKKALGSEGCNIIDSIDIRPIKGNVYYISSDGREVDTENLPDGYRRLINIVVDIAFRCMLLNKGIHGINACEKTEGTVLIDEIDLHLHPTLQSLVLKGLQNAFPLLQFFITSHAPMIMTSIPMDDKNKIYMLGYSQDKGYEAKEIKTYGLDASTIIEAILGVTPRSKEVDERLKILFSLIDSDDYLKATDKLREMRKEFGDNLPELAKAEAMLNFLTEDNDNNK